MFLMSGIWSQAQTIYQNDYVKFVYGNFQGAPGLFVQTTQAGVYKINWECGTQSGTVPTMGGLTRVTWGEIHGTFIFKLSKFFPPNSTSNTQWKVIGWYYFYI